ncbi:hypothetical protein [Pseudoalteromonas caenipelagi]|uniref:hypothetical protein n=1 Tax=Pseudoalteromonas caenipelagi TaxID=2726988 RepID=UPI003F6E3938
MDEYLSASHDVPSSFVQIKADPWRIGLDTVLKEIEKLSFINSLNLPNEQLIKINPKILTRFKQRVSPESAWEVKRHPDHIRYAMMLIFFYLRKSELIDGLIELFCQIVHRLSVRAERKVVKELMRNYQKVYGKNTLLLRIAEAALGNPEGVVKDIVYPIANEQTLENLVKEFKSSGKGYKKEVHKVIRSSYGSHYRRMVPKILNSLNFNSNNDQHRPVLTALEWLNTHKASKRQHYLLSEDIPIEGVIRPKWRDIVVEIDDNAKERINRINYEICVLQALRDKLRCKEVWVSGADRYRNPDEDLPQDFS